jgi:hypothetical protein
VEAETGCQLDADFDSTPAVPAPIQARGIRGDAPWSSRAHRLDRAALAALLTEVAMRLTNEFTLPGVGGDSRG